MNEEHLTFERIRAYLTGALSAGQRSAVEKHLAFCASCRQAVEAQREIEAGREAAQSVAMSPEARLRLYERLNALRSEAGDAPIPIPRHLLAQVKAKAEATAQAAAHVARTTGSAAREIGTGGAAVAAQAARGAAKVGKKAARTVKAAAQSAIEMGEETVKTAADLKTIAVDETAATLRKAKEHPVDLAATPIRLAAKGMKAGGRMAEGAAKNAYAATKGGIKVAAGTASTMGTALVEGTKTGITAAKHAPRLVKAAKKVADGLAEGVRQIAEAKPEEAEGEDEP